MLAIERQQLIMQMLRDKGNVSTNELSIALSVSPVTIRKDLTKLSNDGLITKTHGGATLLTQIQVEAPENVWQSDFNFKTRELTNKDAKEMISEYALSLIQDNQCILLDGSSTALTLAKKLSRFNKLLVITNGIYTMLALKDNPAINVIMIGGMVTKNSGSVEGLLGADLLNHIHIDTAFVSARGFSVKEGFTDFNVYEVELKKAMLKKCNKVVALLDSSKFEHVSTSSFLAATDADLLLTDDQISKEYLQKYMSNNIAIKVCPRP